DVVLNSTDVGAIANQNTAAQVANYWIRGQASIEKSAIGIDFTAIKLRHNNTAYGTDIVIENQAGTLKFNTLRSGVFYNNLFDIGGDDGKKVIVNGDGNSFS